MGQPLALDLVDPQKMFIQCDRIQPLADHSMKYNEMSSTHDIDNEIVITDEPATSIGTSLSGDSGIQSLDEPWEDASVVQSEVEEERYGVSGVCDSIQQCVALPHVPTKSDEDRDNVYPLLDSGLIRKSHTPPIGRLQTDEVNSQSTEVEEEYSDRDVDPDDSSSGMDESGFDDSRVPQDIVDPPDMSTWGMREARQQWEVCSSMIIGSDAGDLDVCNLADFSSDEEDTPTSEIYECPETNVDTVPKLLQDIREQCDTGSSVITGTDGRDYDICNLSDFCSDEDDNNGLDSTVCSDINIETVTELSPVLSREYDASSSFITETDGGSYDICNLADFRRTMKTRRPRESPIVRTYTLVKSRSCHMNLVNSKIRFGNTNLMLYAGRWWNIITLT